MPMQSQFQRSFLWANEPDIADEFEQHTPKGKALPRYKLHRGAGHKRPKHRPRPRRQDERWLGQQE